MRRTYIATLCSLSLLVGCGDVGRMGSDRTFQGTTMGTHYVVRVGALPVGTTTSALRTEIENTLERIDAAMSTYRVESEISRFNLARNTDWFTVSRETRAVIDEALRVSKLTHGAFDISVGPLVELWGFGTRSNPPAVPADPAIRAVMAAVGPMLVETHIENPAIRKVRPEVEISLSAIAKGYAVDALADQLTASGVASFLVEIGGELRVRGRNPAGDRWHVAVQKPTGDPAVAELVMAIEDLALATSGDYRNFFTDDGVRYSHVLDPRTGRPVAHDLVSVTVADDSAMRADALATGLLVLGPQLGRLLATQLGVPALFVSDGPEGFVRFATPAFEELLVQNTEGRSET